MDEAKIHNSIAAQFRRARWAIQQAQVECAESVQQAATLAVARMLRGGKLLVAGNGGSAADAQHLAAEFTGRLNVDRRALPAIALNTDTSALTAIGNDYGFSDVFARQIAALGRPEDVFIGISTSGRSPNVINALMTARDLGLATIMMTGKQHVDSAPCDVAIRIPSHETARIQEAHGVIIHAFAQCVERGLTADLAPHSMDDQFPFLLPQADFSAFRDWITDTGQQLVTTNGVFDLLHHGHVWTLEQARRHGDRLVVLVNDDASTGHLKGPGRPVLALEDRVRSLRSVAAVDHVAVMQGDIPVDDLESLRPHVHAKGADYSIDRLPEAAVVTANGGRIELLDMLSNVSTTTIVGAGYGP